VVVHDGQFELGAEGDRALAEALPFEEKLERLEIRAQALREARVLGLVELPAVDR